MRSPRDVGTRTLLCFFALTLPVFAVTKVAVLPVGSSPVAVALNAQTQLLYTANDLDGSVGVVDTVSDAVVTTIPVGSTNGIAVNPLTNLIYANTSTGVAVIDGVSNTVVARVATGFGEGSIAVNQDLNRIYAANSASDTVSVIDGTSNTLIDTVTVGDSPYGVAVDRVAGDVYVTNETSGTVTVFNGQTDKLRGTVVLPGTTLPNGIVIDSALHRAYVTDNNLGKLDVISTTTLTLTSVVTGFDSPHAVAVNARTHQVFVLDFAITGGDVLRVDWQTLGIIGSFHIPTSPFSIITDSKPNEEQIFVGGKAGLYVLAQ